MRYTQTPVYYIIYSLSTTYKSSAVAHEAELRRGRRYQILPAYTQDGILLSRVFWGIAEGDVFENYLGGCKY